MFYRRRRLQVLLSLLVIVVASLYLGSQLLSGVSPVVAQTSQVGEAMFFLRHSYVDEVNESALLKAGAAALTRTAKECGVASLPEWELEPGVAGDEALRRFEVFFEKTLTRSEGQLAREKATYAALEGITAALKDPYTRAMDPATYARFREHLHSQAYGGIGIEVELVNGRYVVFEIAPDSPAALSGIQVGDILLSIDDHDLSAEPLEVVSQMLTGEADTRVRLRLERDGSPYERELIRVVFKTRSVHGRIFGKVGWISVSSMAESTGQEMLETVEQLGQEGAQVLVLDLRDNVGGYLNAGLEVASIFLESGQPVVMVKSRDSSESKHTIGNRVEDKPLLVLLNGRTASSAEILAGALSDHGRAELIGSTTFGKGSIQTLHDFADGGGFKLTTSRYLTPLGNSIEGRGLTPDYKLSASILEDEELLKDAILKHCRKQWKL